MCVLRNMDSLIPKVLSKLDVAAPENFTEKRKQVLEGH